MANKICIAELPEFDPAAHLKREEEIAAYLAAVVEENDPVLLAAALNDVARGRSVREFVRSSTDTPNFRN